MTTSAFRLSKQSLWLWVLFTATLLVFIPDRSADSLYILAPLFISLWLCAYCIISVWKKDGELPIVDAGVFCVIVTTLYTVVPLLNFYFGGLNFGLLSDTRLTQYRPTAQELGLFFVNYVVYLASLTFAYVVFRRSDRWLPSFKVTAPRPSTVRVLVCAFLILTIYFGVLLYGFGIGFKSGYGDESNISAGPMWLEQIDGKLSELKFLFQAGLVAFLVLRKHDLRMRIFLFMVIAWNIVVAFSAPGHRGDLVSLLLMTYLFWHKFYGTNIRFTFVFVPVVFVGFMFLGLARSFLDLDDLRSALDAFETVASANNEFQSMLGTAFDVHKMVESGVTPPAILALNDFMPMLPPQQLWPFQKLTGADWYLVQIGQDGTGVGYMWGVISQSIVELGLIGLMIRGVVLGWFLAFIHRWYQRRYTKFLPTVFYVNLVLTSLWTFRDTTGALLWTIWWAMIPFALVFYLFGLRSEFAPISAKDPAVRAAAR